MKRKHEPLPNTIVFDEIPSDIWFVVLGVLSSLRDISRMGKVCHSFSDMAKRRVQKLSSEVAFDYMHARYVYDREKYWPIEVANVLRQTWRPKLEVDAMPFPRALVLFVSNFIELKTSLTFSLWGDKYELVSLLSKNLNMTGKFFIVHRRKGVFGNECFCLKYINPFMLEMIKNVFKDQLCKGLGTKKRIDIHYRLPSVVLLFRLLNNLRCSVCCNNAITNNYEIRSGDRNIVTFFGRKSVKIPLCIMNPNSKTHMFV